MTHAYTINQSSYIVGLKTEHAVARKVFFIKKIKLSMNKWNGILDVNK